jgi:2-hydroxy-6-oxonona-2,4-dienedioate hydrolase
MIIGLFKLVFKIIKWSIGVILILFVILSVIPYLFSSNQRATDAKPYENSEFHYYSNTKFHYRVFKPEIIKHKVLLIHGFSASTFSFRKNSDFLKNQECLVIALDMPGFGYSDKSSQANYSDLEKINALNEILSKHDSLISDNSPWIIVGHSMGANTSAQFAIQYPNKTKALIWIDGAAISKDISAYSSFTLYPPLLKWADVVLEKHFLNYDKFNELLSSAYGSNPDSSDVIGYMKPFEIPGSGSAVFRMFAGIGNIEINQEKINQFPKLIIWGKNDQWIPFTEIQKNIKGNVMLIDEAGHCPMETHSTEVNQMMINFIHNLNLKKE